jgi:hypothetical protein
MLPAQGIDLIINPNHFIKPAAEYVNTVMPHVIRHPFSAS